MKQGDPILGPVGMRSRSESPQELVWGPWQKPAAALATFTKGNQSKCVTGSMEMVAEKRVGSQCPDRERWCPSQLRTLRPD